MRAVLALVVAGAVAASVPASAPARVRQLRRRSGRKRGSVHAPARPRSPLPLVVAVVVASALAPGLGVATACLALGGPPLVRWWSARRARHRARAEAVRDLPDVVDLFRLAAAVGGNARLAVDAVVDLLTGAFAGPFASVARSLSLGVPLPEALTPLRAVGDGGAALADAVAGAAATGAALDPLLARVGEDARRERRAARSRAARTVPVKLLFPLVLCTLPGFGLLTVVPLLVRALPDLQL